MCLNAARRHRRSYTSAIVPDKPHLRLRMLAADVHVGGDRAALASRRVAALRHRRGMTDGTHSLVPVSGASNWIQLGPMATPTGPPYSANKRYDTGRLTAIVIDPTAPQTLYLGTAKGGVWKTIDGGGTWSPMSDNEVSLAIGALTLDPTAAQTVYAGTGEGNEYFILNDPFTAESYYGAGFLKSTNGGMSWTTHGQAEFTGAAFFRIAVHPTNPSRVWAATTNGLFLSDTAGTSWTKLTSGLPNAVPGLLTGCTDIVLHPTDPTIAFTAFWGSGIYKSTNANAPNPTFALVPSIPMFTHRASIAFAPSDPQRMNVAALNTLYYSTNGGQSFKQTGAPLDPKCLIEDYSNHIAIDPTTPDVVYLSGYSQLMKFTFDPVATTWSGVVIGTGAAHADHHAFAFDPNDHQHVYAGTDGGIYESHDGGGMWSDAINRGLCIPQFDFIDQHPVSDTVVWGGTQDNGTQQYRNSPVFRQAEGGGDGGFCAVDFNNPNNVLHTFYLVQGRRSSKAGEYLTFQQVLEQGLSGNSLFYPPMTLCAADPLWVAFGTDQIYLDKLQGTGSWPIVIPLPGATAVISAIQFVSKTLMYCGTAAGEVYAVRSMNGGVDWTATAIHAAPFPARFVWDIAVVPNNSTHIVVVVSGFGTGHVWRGTVPVSGVAAWTNASGAGATAIPDIPANSIVIDPNAPKTYYVGTDIGVFRTTNDGGSWTNFGQGLPNTAVFDLRLLGGSVRLLRAATHGRGIWERRLDVASMPDVDLYVRHHAMDSGRGSALEGVSAAFRDQGQYIDLGDSQHHWMCHDIKVDALAGNPLAYQFNVNEVDFVVCESRLYHRNAERGNINRVYVQVHNRGITKAANVTVKLLFADSTAKVPLLPGDFWTAFPADSADPNSKWFPIGATKTVSVPATLPAVLEWDWATPMNQATHSCLLVIVNSAADPIPAANKIFNVDTLVKIEKRAGLKNLHVVDAPPMPPKPAPPPYIWSAAILDLLGSPEKENSLSFDLLGGPDTTIGFFLPNGTRPLELPKRSTLTMTRPTTAQLEAARLVLGDRIAMFDLANLYSVTGVAEASTPFFAIPERGLRLAILLGMKPNDAEMPPRFHVKQHDRRELVGGSTFVLVAG